MRLRRQLIRLAYEDEGIRPHLLALLAKRARYFPVDLPGIRARGKILLRPGRGSPTWTYEVFWQGEVERNHVGNIVFTPMADPKQYEDEGWIAEDSYGKKLNLRFPGERDFRRGRDQAASALTRWWLKKEHRIG